MSWFFVWCFFSGHACFASYVNYAKKSVPSILKYKLHLWSVCMCVVCVFACWVYDYEVNFVVKQISNDWDAWCCAFMLFCLVVFLWIEFFQFITSTLCLMFLMQPSASFFLLCFWQCVAFRGKIICRKKHISCWFRSTTVKIFWALLASKSHWILLSSLLDSSRLVEIQFSRCIAANANQTIFLKWSQHLSFSMGFRCCVTAPYFAVNNFVALASVLFCGPVILHIESFCHFQNNCQSYSIFHFTTSYSNLVFLLGGIWHKMRENNKPFDAIQSTRNC